MTCVRRQASSEGALYRAEDVESARVRLQTRYRREGLRTASFTTRETFARPTPPSTWSLSYGEGPRQVIQEITISGLRQVDEDVVRRQSG